MQQIIIDLDSNQFAVREKALKELAQIGEEAEAALKKALESKPSLETRRRIEQLLDKLGGPVIQPDILRGIRAVAALEHLGTAEASQMLRTLAQGTPEAKLTKEARASLERLAKRVGPKP